MTCTLPGIRGKWCCISAWDAYRAHGTRLPGEFKLQTQIILAQIRISRYSVKSLTFFSKWKILCFSCYLTILSMLDGWLHAWLNLTLGSLMVASSCSRSKSLIYFVHVRILFFHLSCNGRAVWRRTPLLLDIRDFVNFFSSPKGQMSWHTSHECEMRDCASKNVIGIAAKKMSRKGFPVRWPGIIFVGK